MYKKKQKRTLRQKEAGMEMIEIFTETYFSYECSLGAPHIKYVHFE